MKIHPVFHVQLLEPYEPNTIAGRVQSPPEPVVTEEGEEEYEVEAILDSRRRRNSFDYLVKWKGYSAAENSWELIKNLEHASELVAKFHQIHPGAPCRIAGTVFSQLPFHPYTNFTEFPTDYPTSSKISGVS